MKFVVHIMIGATVALLNSAVPVFGTTKIMPLGDSITRGFLGDLVENGSYRQYVENQLLALEFDFDLVGNYRVDLGGIADSDYQAVGGYNIERMTLEFGVAIKQHQPNLILALAGTNNIWDEPDLQQFVQRYDSLVRLAQDKAPQTKLVFATVPPWGCCPPNKKYWTAEWAANRNEVHIETMNAALRMVAAQYDDVTVANYNEVFDVATDLADDKAHPNASGQRKLGQVFLGAMGDLRLGLFNATHIDRLTEVVVAGGLSPRGDLNADGVVDFDDRTYFLHDVLGTTMGDSNLDGRFDSNDLVLAFEAGEYEDGIENNSGWADGDWNGDTEFNSTDIIAAFQFAAYENLPSVPVPEPGSAKEVFGFAILLVAACKRNRRGARRAPATAPRHLWYTVRPERY